MPQSPCYKAVHIKPVTGPMDVRSNPDEVPFGGYRWVQNFEVTQKFKLCRLRGWRKLQSREDYNNQDLHDQNVAAELPDPPDYVRQPIQWLWQAESPAGFSKLFAATANRLYAKSNSNGNWKVLTDRMGPEADPTCSDEIRWSAGVVNQTVVFTNARDRVVYHVIDQPTEDDGQSVKFIPDLEELRISRATVVHAWNDIVLLFNVTQDGAQLSDRIIWSDYQRPLSYKPDVGVSMAGTKDLGAGETILNVAPMKDALMIYTTRGIWEMRTVGGEGVFGFSKRYSAPEGSSRCLAYPLTLVSSGDENYYFASEGIYQYNYYLPEPKLVDFIHRASSLIFDEIDKTRCSLHVGGYHADTKSVWWSWVSSGESCPSKSLVINLQFPFSSYVDHGFTAFLNYSPDVNKSLRDFILGHCICNSEDLNYYFGQTNDEGGLCNPVQDPECDIDPVNFFSHEPLSIAGITVEDYTGDADMDSLYAILGDTTIQDECASEYRSDECNAGFLFAMASSEDWCIKEFAEAYYRETCTSHVGCGEYQSYGYVSILRSGPIDLNLPDDDKVVGRFAIEAHPAVATVPSTIQLKIGVCNQALDPNEPNAGNRVILWEQQDDKAFDAMGDANEATHRADGTRPSDAMEWLTYLTTRYIYFELQIVNPDVIPPNTGGAGCFSRFTFDAAPVMRCI